MRLETRIYKPERGTSTVATYDRPFVVHIMGIWTDEYGDEQSWVQLWDAYKTLDEATVAAEDFALKYADDADFSNEVTIEC